MIQLDKTFPTLDCSACILTPKMVDVANHPNIELMTYSQVEDISGYVGNFDIKVRKRSRYVDIAKCTGCGDCAEACRMAGRFPNQFDEGMGMRGAIYMPFPQAVPAKYTIDKETCLFLTKGKCGRKPQVRGRLPGQGHRLRTGRRNRGVQGGHHHRGHRLRRLRRQAEAGVRLRGVRQRAHRPGVRAPGQRLRPHRRKGHHDRAGQEEEEEGRRGGGSCQDPQERHLHPVRGLPRQERGQRVLLPRLLHVHGQAGPPGQGQGPTTARSPSSTWT